MRLKVDPKKNLFLPLILSCFLTAGCTEFEPVSSTLIPATTPPPVTEPTTAVPKPPAMQSKSGQLTQAMDFETSELKTSTELDELLNDGSVNANSKATSDSFFDLELQLNLNFEFGNHYDTTYYDYDEYYDEYDYVDDFYYEEEYIEEYETYTYYQEEYYETDFFVSYPNYSYRSSVITWSTYTWPSGYGFLTCYAQNFRGDTFFGYGYPAYFAEAAAMATCESTSQSACIPIGCR